MVDITIILPTARESYQAMIGLPETHILGPCVESLKKQTFQNFELIIVDALYEYRTEMFKKQPFQADKLSFPVKHVPIHPNHRFWLERRRGSVSGAMNTGIIYAEGELLVKLDDCCEFNEDYLERVWREYQNGYFALALHTRFRYGKQAYYTKELEEEYREADQKIEAPLLEETSQARTRVRLETYGEGGPVRDSRWSVVESKGRLIAPKNWFYGYSCFSLEAALKLNGFDELFDGDSVVTLVDVDMGQRLAMAGYHKFLLDKNIWVIEHEHDYVSPRAITPRCGNIKCNYAIMKLNEKKHRWRANNDKLTEEDLEFVKEESLRPPCQWEPHQWLDDCRGEMFKLWASHQPIFDLREERLNV